MVPRADIVAIEIESMLDDLIKLINKEVYSLSASFSEISRRCSRNGSHKGHYFRKEEQINCLT